MALLPVGSCRCAEPRSPATVLAGVGGADGVAGDGYPAARGVRRELNRAHRCCNRLRARVIAWSIRLRGSRRMLIVVLLRCGSLLTGGERNMPHLAVGCQHILTDYVDSGLGVQHPRRYLTTACALLHQDLEDGTRPSARARTGEVTGHSAARRRRPPARGSSDRTGRTPRSQLGLRRLGALRARAASRRPRRPRRRPGQDAGERRLPGARSPCPCATPRPHAAVGRAHQVRTRSTLPGPTLERRRLGRRGPSSTTCPR